MAATTPPMAERLPQRPAVILAIDRATVWRAGLAQAHADTCAQFIAMNCRAAADHRTQRVALNEAAAVKRPSRHHPHFGISLE